MNLEDRETTTVIMNTNEYTNAYSKLMATDTRTNDWSNELFDVHERKSDTSGDGVHVIGERNAHSISVLHLCVCVYVGFLDSLRREVSCTYEWMVSDVLFFRGCCRIGWDCRNFSPSKNRLTVSIQTYFCSWWKCTVESTSGNSDHNIITVKDWYESFHSSSCRHLWTFPAQVDRQKTNSWFKNKPELQRMCQNHRCRERMAE